MHSSKSHQFFHPWHAIASGNQAPHIVQAIIEISQGSKAKYELDKTTGLLRLDRILASNLSYPFHYGFIPQTFCQDDDPLDIVIICSEALLPLSIVEATVLGGIEMLDSGQQDDKIIAVAAHDPFMKNKHDLQDLNPEILNAIQHFFINYKNGEQKTVEVKRFLSKDESHALIQDGMGYYKKKFT